MSIAKLVSYDIVVENGRVIDPGTGIDVEANIGISNGSVCAIVVPEQKLDGEMVIDASGLVVAPGFIDIHTHEDSQVTESAKNILPPLKTMQCFVLDGVTTMIGGNCGGSVHPITDYFSILEQDGCLINYASYCGHTTLRNLVGASDRYAAATLEQVSQMRTLAEQDMQAGALGVSYGIMYTPGLAYHELLALARVSAGYGGITAAHARCGWDVPEAVDSINEMIRLSKDSGIAHEYSHIGSMTAYGKYMDQCLEAMNKAQAEGIGVFADIYPYCAWNTGVGAAIMDEGFFDRYNCTLADLETPADVIIDGEIVMHRGDRYTQELFDRIRPLVLEGKIPDPAVIGHVIKRDKVKLAMSNPYVMIGSDGGVGTNSKTKQVTGHPRVAGTYAKFLGEFVRQEGLMDIKTALFKCSTLPAEVLGLRNKGRMSIGADADITIFNADTVIDKSTFGAGFMEPPEGIEYVIVNGILTVNKDQLVSDAMPGKVIRRTWKTLKNSLK